MAEIRNGCPMPPAPTEPPPPDLDAVELADAYARGKREGRAEAIADAVKYLRRIFHSGLAGAVEDNERELGKAKEAARG